MEKFIAPIFLAVMTTALIVVVVGAIRSEARQRAARPQLAIRARYEAEFAWGVAEAVYAEVESKLGDVDRRAVLDDIYARIKIALEDRR